MKRLTSDNSNFDRWMSEMMKPSDEEILSNVKTIRITYESFIAVGFTDKEAMELVKHIMTVGGKGGKQ